MVDHSSLLFVLALLYIWYEDHKNNEAIEGRDDEVRRLQNELRESESKVYELEIELEEKSNALNHHKEEISSLNKKIAEQSDEIAAMTLDGRDTPEEVAAKVEAIGDQWEKMPLDQNVENDRGRRFIALIDGPDAKMVTRK